MAKYPLPEKLAEFYDFIAKHNINVGDSQKLYERLTLSFTAEDLEMLKKQDEDVNEEDEGEEEEEESQGFQFDWRKIPYYIRYAWGYARGSMALWPLVNALWIQKYFGFAARYIPTFIVQYWRYILWAIRALVVLAFVTGIGILFPPTREMLDEMLYDYSKSLYNTYLDGGWMVHVGIIVVTLLRVTLLSALKYVREKNVEATWEKNRDENDGLVTAYLHPKLDDPTKWEQVYPSFWEAIHSTFSASDKQVLLAKDLEYASFEVLRFGSAYMTNVEDAPTGGMAVTIRQSNMGNITRQLKSIHSEITAEIMPKTSEFLYRIAYTEDPENGVEAYYQDYIPVGGSTSVLNIDVTTDPMATLSSQLSMPKDLLAAGVMVLVRDAPNAHKEITDYLNSLTMTPEGKRRSLSALEKDQVKKLEAKVRATQASLTYNIVIRVFAIGKKDPPQEGGGGMMGMMGGGGGENKAQERVKNTVNIIAKWIEAIKGSNTFQKINEGTDVETIVERRYPHVHNILTVVTPPEMASIWHIPDAKQSVSFLSRTSFKMLEPNAAIVARPGMNARIIGRYPTSDGEWVEVAQFTDTKNPPAMKHTLVTGPTGTGKSVLAAHLIMDDINSISSRTGRPYSVIVLEPHADLTNDVMARIPNERLEDVIIIDPLDPMPTAINFMHTEGRPDSINKDTAQAVNIMSKAIQGWESMQRSAPFTARAISTLMSVLPRMGQTPTIFHLEGFLRSGAYRQYIFDNIPPEMRELRGKWGPYMMMSENEQQAIFTPITYRLETLTSNIALRRVVGQPRTVLNMRQLIDSGTIILAKLSHELDSFARALLGGLIISLLAKAALSRSDIPAAKRHNTMFYMDEFQTMAPGNGKQLASLLAEVRKYQMGLTLIHQNLAQLSKDPELLNAALQNTLNKLLFRMPNTDARRFVKEQFEGKLQPSDFTQMRKYMVHAVLVGKDDNQHYATVYTLPPDPPRQDDSIVFNKRDLYKDTAQALGLPWPSTPDIVMATTPAEMVAHMWAMLPHYPSYANLRAEMGRHGNALPWPKIDNAVLNKIISVFETLPLQKWNEVMRINQEFQHKQRELLLKDPSYIEDTNERVAHLSRLKVGTPVPLIDSLIRRVIREIEEAEQKYRDNSDSGGGIDSLAFDEDDLLLEDDVAGGDDDDMGSEEFDVDDLLGF